MRLRTSVAHSRKACIRRLKSSSVTPLTSPAPYRVILSLRSVYSIRNSSSILRPVQSDNRTNERKSTPISSVMASFCHLKSLCRISFAHLTTFSIRSLSSSSFRDSSLTKFCMSDSKLCTSAMNIGSSISTS